MKRFTYRLEQVLALRSLRAKVEESALEKLHAELHTVAARTVQIKLDRDRAGKELVAGGHATGVELAFLDSFRKGADMETARLETAQVRCRAKIQAQMTVVADRRRDVRMLEKLKEKKFQDWQRETTREMDRQASETHLARLHRWNATQ